MNQKQERNQIDPHSEILSKTDTSDKNYPTAENNQVTSQKKEKIQTEDVLIQNTQKCQERQDNGINCKKQQIIEEKGQNCLSTIECQLLQMGFNKQLVRQALKLNKDKDKAIQYIISTIQNEQKPQTKQNKKKPQKCQQQKMKAQKPGQDDSADFQDETQDYKMVFLVRMDLKMGLGKIAAQVGHAVLKAYKQIQAKIDKSEVDEINFFQWMEGGAKKIVLKVQDLKQLEDTLTKAEQLKLNYCYIRDAGLTQVASGSMTVGAIGPAASSEIDSITKQFKLL